MAKRSDDKEDPRIEDFITLGYVERRRSNRRSITLWIDQDIIEACKPMPATKLRKWIEAEFWKKAS